MLCREVKNYISTAKGLPFFYIVGDEDYKTILEDFKQEGLSVVRMSDFCHKEDKYPSVDELIDCFHTSDVDHKNNKFVVIGLGEYLCLRGTQIADKELRRLKTTTLGNARVILLLRGISEQANRMVRDDNRIVEQQRVFFSENQSSNIKIININDNIEFVTNRGIKSLLHLLEDGWCNEIMVTSSLLLDSSIFPISNVKGAYSIIRLILKDFDFQESCGTKEQWDQLLCDLIQNQKSLESVFKNYGVDDGVPKDFRCWVSSLDYIDWLTFLYLKKNKQSIENIYLKMIIGSTNRFEDLKNNLLIGIVSLSHNDSNFRHIYDDRKRLLKDFPDEDIAIFIKENEVNQEESIYRLTDNTSIEKKTIIKWIVQHGFSEAISYVYPDLNDYLKKYFFEGVLSEELTEYFDAYKKQKVTNVLSDDFIKLVENHASNLSYTQLPTRDNAMKSIANKDSAFLYWIDALGVEYLSFITALAKEKGLSIDVDIVRSDLPTITSINKQFYEQWDDKRRFKEDKLDNIKHKDKGGYFFTDDEDPIHIAEELDVIKKAIERAALELKTHKYKSFIIASDHGASRLAVIKRQEVPYDTDTQGEHSGRCCKLCDGFKAPYSITENDYIVLSDYGRFRKSRSANVEVHGGASLEEIVVPIITLKLKKQVEVKITVLDPDNIVADRHIGVILNLYISDVESPNNVRIIVDGKTYNGNTKNGKHFVFELKDIKRARKGQICAEVFDASNLIGAVSFFIKSKTTIVKNDFDFGDEV